MVNRFSGGASASVNGAPLRLLRLEPGESATIRTIDPTYRGLNVHYLAKRNEYCLGDECPPHMHKLPSTWKGYAGVERWDEDRKVWFCAVLEITEGMELDFREKWARGQEWIVSRRPRQKKKGSGCYATFVRRLDPNKLRKPFCIVPPILTVYHQTRILLDQRSPVPARVFLEASAGEAPLAESKDAGQAPPSKEQWEEFRRVVGNGFKVPE